MKRIIMVLSLVLLAACSNGEVKYDGTPLKIAVIGEIPPFQNKNIRVESVTLDNFIEDSTQVSAKFDAVMLTEDAFEAASDDKFIDVYNNSEIPIVFLNSSKRHYPFVTEGITYETAHDSLTNGSHTTVYLHDDSANKDDAWFFYLDDKKDTNDLYTNLFRKIDEL
ncbi:amino acid oxidase [Peribacillus sp. NPDC097675]|uniref:amino acid oxidase n=1 Tax=Peribacillus sp. NPDC097675 TaxID=3390618 RepID=UPI003CFD40BE